MSMICFQHCKKSSEAVLSQVAEEKANKILELQYLLTQFSNVTTDFLRPWQNQISVIA